MKNGTEDVKRHRWFKALDWEEVYYKQLKPPILPKVQQLVCAEEWYMRLEMAQTMAWSENSRLSRQLQIVPTVSDCYDCCGRDFTQANPRV